MHLNNGKLASHKTSLNRVNVYFVPMVSSPAECVASFVKYWMYFQVFFSNTKTNDVLRDVS